MILSLVLAFLLGGFIVWRMNSRARQDAASRRIAVALALPERPWWHAVPLSEKIKVPYPDLYVTLIRFEHRGLVERRWDPNEPEGQRRSQYRWIGPVQPSQGSP